MPAKTKTQQAENLEEAQNRDLFQTPNYAVDIILPFLSGLRDKKKKGKFTVWECAAGQRKISKRLEMVGFDVVSTDIQDETPLNFLTDKPDFEFDCIITNVPFSLKKKFFEKCLSYEKPFLLLLPADYSLWLIDAVDKFFCEKIIPKRRVDYITPNILERIHIGEVISEMRRDDPFFGDISLKDIMKGYKKEYDRAMKKYNYLHNYASIYDAPSNLLRKYSSSDFHSMWLTRHLNLGKSETFVELTNEMKNNI